MLINIQREYQLDAIQKQQLSKEVAALYGSLALLYAKHVHQGLRSLDSLHPMYANSVTAILAYIKENGYGQILQ